MDGDVTSGRRTTYDPRTEAIRRLIRDAGAAHHEWIDRQEDLGNEARRGAAIRSLRRAVDRAVGEIEASAAMYPPALGTLKTRRDVAVAGLAAQVSRFSDLWSEHEPDLYDLDPAGVRMIAGEVAALGQYLTELDGCSRYTFPILPVWRTDDGAGGSAS